MQNFLFPSKQKTSYLHHRIKNIAVPAMLAQVTLPLLGLVDTAVMGHFASTAALTAVVIGGGMYMIIANGAGFLRSATLGFIAQSWGAGDWQRLRDWYARSLILAGALSILLIMMAMIGLFLLPTIGTAVVNTHLHGYLGIRLWGLPAYLFSLAFVGVMLGCQDARSVLRMMLLTNICNIMLDFLLVAGFSLGTEGVALATLIAEHIGAAYGFCLVRKHFRHRNLSMDMPIFIQVMQNLMLFRRLLSLNFHLFIRSTLLSLSFAYLPIAASAISTEIAATNAVMLNLWFMSGYILDGVANAAESLCGRAIGRKMPRLLKMYILQIHLWCIPVIICSLTIFYAFWPELIALQTSDTTVRDLTLIYQYWFFLMLFLSPWCILLDGVYYGAALGREVSRSMILAAAIFFTSTVILVPSMGNSGIWIALMLLFFVRGVGLYYYLPNVLAKASKG